MNYRFAGFLAGLGLLSCVGQAQANVLITNLNMSAVSALNTQVGVASITGTGRSKNAQTPRRGSWFLHVR
jgi:hypothetical protein